MKSFTKAEGTTTEIPFNCRLKLYVMSSATRLQRVMFLITFVRMGVSILHYNTVDSLVATSSAKLLNQQQRQQFLDKSTIRSIQVEKEQYLRSVHDNHVFNQLFVNVPEYPDPIRYHISMDDTLQNDVTERKEVKLLPWNFPPGCLLRHGPNGAPSSDGFMDGDGFVNCITFPPSIVKSTATSTVNNNESSDNKDTIDNADVFGTFSSTYVETRGRMLESNHLQQKKFVGTLGSVPYALPLLSSIIQNAINFNTLQCQKDTCNTALGLHKGRILALMEQCPPSEIQVTKSGRIRTIANNERLNNAIPWSPVTGGSLSAHGRTCPITNERIHVSYDSNAAPYIRVDIFGGDNVGFHLQRTIPITVPCPTMIHDCAITNSYVVIFDFPLTLRTSRFLKNQFPVEYEPEYGARIGLLPRNAFDDSNIQWFECEPGIVLHTVNAYDEDDNNTVIVQVLRSEPDGSKGYLEEFTTSFLYEYELDVTSGRLVSERCLNPYEAVEFPIINSKYIGQKSNPSVYCSSVRSIGGPLIHHKQPVTGITISGVTKFALKSSPDDESSDDNSVVRKGDVVHSFVLPLPWMVVSEPTVVPKTDGNGEFVLLIATSVPTTTKTTENDDYNDITRSTGTTQKMHSQVVVLDGDRLQDGPIWKCDLPHHVHYGLHSLYVDWESMV